jgi:hypothetical protein
MDHEPGPSRLAQDAGRAKIVCEPQVRTDYDYRHLPCHADHGPVQANVDFYVGFVGLRLVKRTGGYEDSTQFHAFSARAIASNIA